MKLDGNIKGLSTAHIADACVQEGVEYRLAPRDIVPIAAGARLAGRVLPVRHSGSVDIFIEVVSAATPGDILVIDDGGRRDQACIGDLIAGEAVLAGLGGILVWGSHRDTHEIQALGVPVFSIGSCPSGPRSASERHTDALKSAHVGDLVVDASDFVVADDDGAIFVSEDELNGVVAVAHTIRQRERQQAELLAAGTSLFEQLRFAEYLERRGENPSYTLRIHLRSISRAIET